MTRFGDELTTLAMAGAVGETSVRIWVRSDAAGPHELVITGDDGEHRARVEVPANGADGTAAWTYPDEVGGRPLQPGSAYRFAVRRGDHVVGEGRFVTAPDPAQPPRRFSFAAFSCHQPFADDGSVMPQAEAMLRAAHQAIVERAPAFALAMGDQIYADNPIGTSLLDPAYVGRSIFECSRDEVRALYQRRYRQCWALPELQRIYASVATWPMLVDHELADNFGSDPAHATAAWQTVRDGALDAYYDYQGSRVLPARRSAFDHGFRWGATAVYQLDLRSERRVGEDRTHVLSEAQLARLEAFLAANATARVLVVMLSIPVAFIASWAARLAHVVPGHASDATDRWTFIGSQHDRDRLFATLNEFARQHPTTNIVLVSGDIHLGTAFEIAWSDGRLFHQLTSSALTNVVPASMRVKYEEITRTMRSLTCAGHTASVRLLDGEATTAATNPYADLNIGFVHVDDDGSVPRVQLELVGADDSGAPITVYRSPWLGAHRT